MEHQQGGPPHEPGPAPGWRSESETKTLTLLYSTANATLRASGMPSVQNVIFKAAKQVSTEGRGTIAGTASVTAHQNKRFFSRLKPLEWSQRLCMITGSNIPTGAAQSTGPFPGNEV